MRGPGPLIVSLPRGGFAVKSKLIYDVQGERVFAVVFDPGEEAASGLLAFAKQASLTAAHFTAIGAFSDVTLGYIDLEKKDYKHNRLREQVEVLSLIGNVALHEGKPKVHAHIVVGRSDGTAHGGHLIEGQVQPTLEVVITESPHHLRRTTDPRTGLALLNLA